ncbi:MAG TPA: peptidoglycan-binding domain-containing protein [Acidimicrobiales bacterium]|nr:peptidoglycan-binding domain-containing protein [Acidimicrobiales bacterium]
MRRRRWVLAATAIGVAAVISGVALAASGGRGKAASSQQTPTKTAKVVKGTLSAQVSLAGILTYRARPDGSRYLVVNQTQGTYTQLPDVGQVMSQGQGLYRVDDVPVVLLYGATPAFRTLTAGTNGPDVAQLNADLVALGYASASQLDPTSSYFGPATTTAVEKLQAVVGLTQTGTLSLGEAVFEPSPVRVTALTVPLGGAAQVGQTVMQATSTTRQVQLSVDASQQTEVSVGDKVTVTLPNNQTTPGVVSAVGTVATCPPASGPGSGPTSTGPGTDTCSSGSSGTSTTPTVTVIVTPDQPAATGTWDQAPVRISITTASVPDALAVPVSALLAQSAGAYAVEVVDPGGAHHLVPVSLGVFDDSDGLVQVTSPQLSAGQQVVVPAI